MMKRGKCGQRTVLHGLMRGRGRGITSFSHCLILNHALLVVTAFVSASTCFCSGYHVVIIHQSGGAPSGEQHAVGYMETIAVFRRVTKDVDSFWLHMYCGRLIAHVRNHSIVAEASLNLFWIKEPPSQVWSAFKSLNSTQRLDNPEVHHARKSNCFVTHQEHRLFMEKSFLGSSFPMTIPDPKKNTR